MNEKFVVAVTASDDTGQPMCHLQAHILGRTAQAFFDLQILHGILDQAAFANVCGLQLELWFDQEQHLALLSEHGCQCGQYQSQGNETQISHDQSKAMLLTQLRQTQFPCIAMFYANDTRVCTQARMKLTMSHIHTRHLKGALLQQSVGEAARRLPHIQARPSFDLQTCFSQSTFELQASTRGVTKL